MSKQSPIARSSIFIFILLLLPGAASAHPHMFLTNKVEFIWEGTQLKGCWLEWTFDQFFSADIIRGYDTDRNGIFNETESKAVFNNAFIYLKNYYYFTFIRQGKNRTNPAGVSKFTVFQKDNKMTYRFFIDLSKTSAGEIYLAVYDYTFYCNITYPNNSVTLDYNPNLIKPSYEIIENKDFPVYYNPLGAADDSTIYYTWKKGLQTYYPREIKIFYEK